MPGNGELIRSLRGGGNAARDAARELQRLGTSGQLNLTHAEVVEVRGLLERPELKDAFTPESRAVLSKVVSAPPAHTAPATSVASLVPDLARVGDPRALPVQFAKDLAVLKRELLDHPNLTPGERATRLFQFFEKYAAHLTRLVEGKTDTRGGGNGQPGTGEFRMHVPGALLADSKTPIFELAPPPETAAGPPLTEAQQAQVAKGFEAALQGAGFAELRELATGRTGLEVARQLLLARSSRQHEELVRGLRFDAPAWSEAAALAQARSGVRPRLDPDALARSPRDEDAPGPRRRGTDKVLGPRMLWNVLHRYRDDGRDDTESAQQREAMNHLLAVGGLVALAIVLAGLVLVLL